MRVCARVWRRKNLDLLSDQRQAALFLVLQRREEGKERYLNKGLVEQPSADSLGTRSYLQGFQHILSVLVANVHLWVPVDRFESG